MEAVLYSPLLLLVPLVAARWVPGGRLTRDRWDWRIDPALALICGIGLGLLWGFWLARYHLVGEAVTAADYQAYCASVTALRSPDVAYWYPMRSVAAGIVPGLLARPLGILDGLAAGALLSAMVLAGSLYLWGRALHGRLAGLAAAICGSAVTPLVPTTRHVSFSPEIAAGRGAGAGGAVLAIRYRRWPAIAAGGVGIGLTLLSDTRGLIYALPFGAVVLAAALWAPRRRIPGRLVALAVPLLVAWFLGGPAFAPTAPLEFQLATSANDTSGAGSVMSETGASEGYRFGHSNPLLIPSTLVTLWQTSSQVSDDFAGREVGERNERHRQEQVVPWLPVAWVCLALSALALWRRPRLLAALLVTALPFAVSLRGTTHWEVTVRYLALAYPILPVLLGVAVGLLAQGTLPAEEADHAGGAAGRWWLAPLRTAVVAGVLLLLVLGLPPSWLSPAAPWRTPFESTPEAMQSSRYAATGIDRPSVPINEVCVEGLRADADAGLGPESAIYGGGR